ncbi:MAG: hypothetical protein AABX29_01645 [Nanoarchaeota archaeon]
MKYPRLVLLKGKPTAGKSTAWYTLRKMKIMKDWLFIDVAHMKGQFANLDDETRKTLGKKLLFFTLKQVMPLKKDIIIEEMSEKTIRKYINPIIKKYKYKIITFYFEVSLETAYKRNIQRAKEKWHPYMKKKKLGDFHEYHVEEYKEDITPIIVDCNRLNKKQVVDFIIKKLGLK